MCLFKFTSVIWLTYDFEDTSDEKKTKLPGSQCGITERKLAFGNHVLFNEHFHVSTQNSRLLNEVLKQNKLDTNE